MEKLEELVKERILILDGAMGTMLQQYHFTEEDFRGSEYVNWQVAVQGNNDLLSVTQPEAVQDVHEQYLEAGADIITTNTFSSTTIAMADYEMEEIVPELNLAAAKAARAAADKYTDKTPDKPRFVAGCLGPTNKTASMSPDVNRPDYRAITFKELKNAYAQQVKYLIKGGVDILLVETVFDTLNAKAALFAIQEMFDELHTKLPIMVSGTITDASGRTLSGQTVEAFLISIEHVPLFSVGLNCALGAKQLLPYLEQLSNRSQFAVSVHPNAGLPNAFGEYDQTAEEMMEEMGTYFSKNLINIVGGCCGTTPDHIRRLSEIAGKKEPRKLMKKEIA